MITTNSALNPDEQQALDNQLLAVCLNAVESVQDNTEQENEIIALISQGANPYRENPQGINTLEIACFAGKNNAAKSLIKAGADINHRDTCKRTALFYAIVGLDHDINPLLLAGGSSLDWIAYLLQEGADPNVQDKFRATILSTVIFSHSLDVETRKQVLDILLPAALPSISMIESLGLNLLERLDDIEDVTFKPILIKALEQEELKKELKKQHNENLEKNVTVGAISATNALPRSIAEHIRSYVFDGDSVNNQNLQKKVTSMGYQRRRFIEHPASFKNIQEIQDKDTNVADKKDKKKP